MRRSGLPLQRSATGLSCVTVAVIGVGGLGCPAALALARCGVGALRLCDGDVVERSNLARQFLYTPRDIGRLKVEAARDRLRALAPQCRVEARACFADERTLPELLETTDLAIEGSDRIETKFQLAQAAHRAQIPAIIGGALGFEGQIFVQEPGAACYWCLFEAPPTSPLPTCRETGVLGPVTALIGGLQAAFALRLLAHGDSGAAGMTIYDGARGRTRRLSLSPRPDCSLCGSPRRGRGQKGGRPNESFVP